MADHERRMQVLAVGFPEARLAEQAEAELRAVLDLGPGDLSIRDVAGDPEFVDGASVVLGGRIREYRLDVVQDVIERNRGVLLTTVPERWVRSDRRASDRASGVREFGGREGNEPPTGLEVDRTL
jgi:hypothetical protein